MNRIPSRIENAYVSRNKMQMSGLQWCAGGSASVAHTASGQLSARPNVVQGGLLS